MKKTISLLMALLIIMTTMVIAASASSENQEYNYTVGDINYTVAFADSNASSEKQELIAQRLVGLDDSNIETYGLGCTLFGHDLKYTTTYVVLHKEKHYAPRCLEKTYEVEYCEDCDYTQETFLDYIYIYCCPET